MKAIKNILLLLLFSFSSVFLHCQNHTFIVTDSISHQPVAYASVIFIQENYDGCYTNQAGEITIPDSVKYIKIAHIQHVSKIVNPREINGKEIFLSPISDNIQPVTPSGKKEKNVGLNTEKKYLVFNGNSGWMLALYIPYQKNWKSPTISAIKCAVDKNPIFEGDFRALMRFDLQKPDPTSGNPSGVSLIKKEIIYDKNTFEENITIPLPEYVEFPKEGVFVVVEWIGTDTKSKYAAVDLQTTSAVKKNFTWTKNIFRGERWHALTEDAGYMHYQNLFERKPQNICVGVTMVE